MKRTDIRQSKQTEKEDALSVFRALSMFYRSEMIHVEDKKELMYHFVRYVINHRISVLPVGKCVRISLRNQASVEALTSQERIVRYYETHYGNQCAQMLDQIFGRGRWKHVVQDTILYSSDTHRILCNE